MQPRSFSGLHQTYLEKIPATGIYEIHQIFFRNSVTDIKEACILLRKENRAGQPGRVPEDKENGVIIMTKETSMKMAELLQNEEFVAKVKQVHSDEEGIALLESVGISVTEEDLTQFSEAALDAVREKYHNLDKDELPEEALDAVAGGKVNWGHFLLACCGIALAATVPGMQLEIFLLGVAAVGALRGY